jgi:2-polyprenyl-3-methyl-5-hydroxy-6-metoxy-1,4-benzoquinol methylase
MPKFNAKLLDGSESTENKDNKNWWQNNPMTYDWDKKLGEPIFDKKYFQDIDEIFGDGHSLVNNPNWPNGSILENFIPYESFRGERVLEIGCGAGLVSSHIARSGAKLHAIDLTEQAILMAKKRFDLSNLTGDIRQMDAENLEFEDDSMDTIVSWGVIHHSGNMVAILDEIYRVLRPGGRAFIMVYNQNSLRYKVYCRFWLGVMKLKLLSNTVEAVAGSVTDGYIARHLNKNEFEELGCKFSSIQITFSDEKTTILKYLFGIGKVFRPFYIITRPFERWLAKRWGWYLEAALVK